jgi:uncharacterized protein YbjT (DUF2867 family)
MPIESRAALVAGGTGLVGGLLLQLLAADKRYAQVTSLVRREASAPTGVKIQVVDFEKLDDLSLTHVDDAFCCLGTTRRAAGSDSAFRRVDLDYVVAFARLARRAGATRFMLVSSTGASARSSLLYPRTKGQCEAAIQAIGFPAVVILRPSFLMGDRKEKRSGEAMALGVARWMGPLLVGPLRRYAPVEAEAVARTLVRSAATAAEGVTIIESDAIE